MTTDIMRLDDDLLGQDLLSRREDFQRQLGDALNADKFIQDAYLAINDNPLLRQCSPESLLGSLYLAAKLRLPVGGPMAQFHLTPRKNWNPATREKEWQVVPVIGYGGLIKLGMDSEQYDTIEGVLVYDGDEFRRWTDESGKHFMHTPADQCEPPRPQGEIIGVIGLATVRGSQRSQWEWVPIEKVLKEHRPDRWEKTPWATHFPQMVQKTGIRVVSKYTSKDVRAERFALAANADENVVVRRDDGELEVVHEQGPTEDWKSLIDGADDRADLDALYQQIVRQEPKSIADKFLPMIVERARHVTKDSRQNKPSPAEVEAANAGREMTESEYEAYSAAEFAKAQGQS